jgi:hypothetical protein
MEIGTILPIGEFPQDPPISLPEDVDSNWAPLEKALETFGRTTMHCTSRHIQTENERNLAIYWEASKYDIGDPPDRTKIPIRSPFRLGLSEEKIKEVAKTIRKWLNVDPPEEYLNLLRLTDGVLGHGFYIRNDSYDRQDNEPFSMWESVMWRRGLMMEGNLTEQGIPEEIEWNFYRVISRDTPLLGGFKCGMVDSIEGDGVGVYLVYFDDTNEEPDPDIEKQFCKHWELLTVTFRGDWCERYQNIPALLRVWADEHRRKVYRLAPLN